jgi:hypothetical protein|tara:strand:- start:217 stop:414 length:198 start_codon:yes stop_codon:yes gene_type:complete
MEITRDMFKSYEGIHELIIVHSSSVRSIDLAQHILDTQNEVSMLKNIIEDFRQKEKRAEKIDISR